MWQLFNRLFGFDYVYIENSAASYVRRVKRAPNGEVYCNPYDFQYLAIPHPLDAKGEHLPLQGKVYGWHATPLTPGVTKGSAQFVVLDNATA